MTRPQARCGRPLRDGGNAYAEAVRQAGVEVWPRCSEDMIPGFFGLGLSPGGSDACAEICRATGDLLRQT